MRHRIKKGVKWLLGPILYLFEDDHAPTHAAYKASLLPYK